MNLGWTEILLIGGIALLLFGPKKLPSLGRSLGESIRGFKKALHEDSIEEKPVEEKPRRTEQVSHQSEGRPVAEKEQTENNEKVEDTDKTEKS